MGARQYLLALATLAAVLALGACRLDTDESAASRGTRAVIPHDAPAIVGTVTDVGGDRRIRIEEQPGESAGSAKAVVRLPDDARILTRDGSRAAFADIRNGMRVSAWFSGPVMESYPVQATASVIVIESGSP